MEPALDQVGWVLAISELYYELNPISLDDFRTTLLKRSLVNGSAIFFSDFTKSRSTTFPNRHNRLKSDLNMSVHLLINILLL